MILIGDDYYKAFRQGPGAYRSIKTVEPDGAIIPCSKGLNSADYDLLKNRAIIVARRRINQSCLDFSNTMEIR